jgi:hypothetical protein
MDTNIETMLRKAYRNSFPGPEAFQTFMADPWEAVQKAEPIEDILLNINASDQDIYYSFLKNVMKTNPMEDLQDEKRLMQLDFKVVMDLWKAQMDYARIMKCMTYSPMSSEMDLEIRYLGAAITVMAKVNPILTLPEVDSAKPIIQLDAVQSDDRQIYMSYLKAILTKKPDMELCKADKEIIALMKKNSVPSDRIKKCFEHSMQFPLPEQMGNDKEYFLAVDTVIKQRTAFFEQAYEEAGRPTMAPEEKVQTDDEIYQEMKNKLRSLKPIHDKEDILSYWSTILNTMRDTLLQLNQAQNTCKVLTLWSIGIEKASKEFDVALNPEVKAIKQRLEEIMQQAQLQEKEWTDIYQIMEKVELFSDQLLQTTAQKQEQNPLFKIPEVQHAAPLQQVLQDRNSTPDKVYFAALREVAQKHSGILPDEADGIIIKQLTKLGKSDIDIMKCIVYSPCLRQLDMTQRFGAAKHLLDISKDIGKELEKGGMRR